jgi:maltose O-acetyltransferase
MTSYEKILEMIAKARNFFIKRKFKKCGHHVQILGKIILHSPENISLGNNCRLNEGVYILGRAEVVIEDNVTISPFAKILTGFYDTSNWVEGNYLEKRHLGKSVYIGHDCWIGTGAIILPGVTIRGQGVIVGAGSVVTKDIQDDFVLVAGNPAKIVKRLGGKPA